MINLLKFKVILPMSGIFANIYFLNRFKNKILCDEYTTSNNDDFLEFMNCVGRF